MTTAPPLGRGVGARRPRSGRPRPGWSKLLIEAGATAAVLGCVLGYLSLAVRQLDRPGLNYDEALHAPAALRLLAPELADGAEPFASVRALGREWPLMTLAYLGAPKSYLVAAGFAALGPGVQALRLVGIVLGAVAVALTFLLARRGWGLGCGLIVTGALASDPSFVLMTRADWGPVALATTLRCAAVYALLRWSRQPHPVPAAIAGLALGLGLYDKANFLWFILALAVVAGIAWVVGDVRPAPRDIGALGAGFFAGSLPFWVWNAVHPLGTFRVAVAGNVPRSAGESLGAALLAELPGRLETARLMLAGRYLDGYMFGAEVEPWLDERWLGGRAETTLLPVLALSAAIVALGVLTTARARRDWSRWGFPAAMGGLILAQVLATPLVIGLHHFASLYPFPQLFVGAALAGATSWAGPGRARRVVGVAATILAVGLVATNLAVAQRYDELMARSPGHGDWSPAIYEVADILTAEYPERTVQLLDWGAGTQLAVLSGGRLRTANLWTVLRAGDDVEPARRAIRDGDNVFLLRAPGRETFPRAGELFWEAAREQGSRPCRRRAVDDADGRPLYEILDLRGCRG